MKALPFPCIRPANEHVIDVVSGAVDVLANADALRGALADGVLIKDPGAAYYLYQQVSETGARTGIACICTIDDLAEARAVANDPNVEEQAARKAGQIAKLGMQTEAVVATYGAQPVLDIIVGAAMQGAPLYDLYDGAGCRHRLWEVKRRDAVDALHTMLEDMTVECVLSPAVLAAAETEREAQVAQAGTHATGKEPFNYALALLCQEDAGEDSAFELPHAMLMHQVSKL